jgi:2-keto-4-pentenoate hydratase/2-oxohepta-3-ene-1,7-dioic acid hydratase in catechol pathway
MRIATYADSDGVLRAGLVNGSQLVDAVEAAGAADLDDLSSHQRVCAKQILHQSQEARKRLEAAALDIAERGDGTELTQLRLVAPVPDPEKVICVGLNYVDHTVEFESEVPTRPVLFAKFATSLIGSGEAIRLPAISSQIDWEGELAVVIGRDCHGIAAEDAMDYVAGCMPFNDVTARDLQAETSQWLAGKALDTFAPCGPALVTMDEVGDIQQLNISTRVNGELVQHACTSEMIFSVTTIIAFISQLMTLRPGDVIATGTPAGVGFRRNPPRFLTPGDVVEVALERVGSLVNEVVAATPNPGAGSSTQERPLESTA